MVCQCTSKLSLDCLIVNTTVWHKKRYIYCEKKLSLPFARLLSFRNTEHLKAVFFFLSEVNCFKHYATYGWFTAVSLLICTCLLYPYMQLSAQQSDGIRVCWRIDAYPTLLLEHYTHGGFANFVTVCFGSFEYITTKIKAESSNDGSHECTFTSLTRPVLHLYIYSIPPAKAYRSKPNTVMDTFYI